MTTNSISLRSPHELLAIVPFVLGFHPTNSIVVVCLRHHRLGLTQRLDLPRPEHAHHVVSALLPALVAENPDSVILIGYEARAGNSLVFGLTVDRVDFLRRSLSVDRQLVGISGRVPCFGPPKTAASVRVIPLPTVVVDVLAAHLATFPTVGLIFTNESGDMIRRSNFGTMWRRTTKSVALDGLHFHDLRHFYASLLIRHGESVKTVQARLGHANAAETLDTYSHLWPDSDDRTREAVDLVLGNPAADSLRTGAHVKG